MKTSIKTIIAAAALTALVAGPASAAIPAGNLNQNIQSVLGTGSSVNATVRGSTVTITGYFADRLSHDRAIRAAKKSAGVDRVINLTRISS